MSLMKKYRKKIMMELPLILLDKFCDILPKRTTILTSILFVIKYRFIGRLREFFFTVFLLEGIEKHKKEKIRVLYLGDKTSLFFISDNLFLKEPEIKILDYISVPKINKALINFTEDIDLIIANTGDFFSRFLQKKGFFVIPAWLTMKLDISKPLSEVIKNFKKSAREDINKIERYGYTYETTKDIEKFNHFFYKIRQPYFLSRIGEQALPGSESYYYLRNVFQYGLLFLVKSKEKYVSGFLVAHNQNNAHPHFMGIIEKPYFEQAAGSALFYFFIKWAKEKGIDNLSFGNTRSFLNNGSFLFKRKWGMTAQMGGFKKIFAFYVNNLESKAVYDFFENNPVFYIQNKSLKGLFFNKNRNTEEEINNILKKYYTPGMKEINIIASEKSLVKFLQGKPDKNIITLKLDDITETLKKIQSDNFDSDNKRIKHILSSEYKDIYKQLVEKFPNYKNSISRTFTIDFTRLKNKGLQIEKINDEILIEIYSALAENRLLKEAVPLVLEYLIKNNHNDVDKAINDLGLSEIEKTKIENIINKIVSEKNEIIKTNNWESFNEIMGLVMKELRGKADGKIVSDILKRKFEEILNE